MGASALLPASKTHLDDVLTVRLALHYVRNIQDNTSHLNSNDLDGNGYSPPGQDGSVDDLCVLQGGRGGRCSACCAFLSRDTSPTALVPGCHHCSDTHFPLGEMAHVCRGLPLPTLRHLLRYPAQMDCYQKPHTLHAGTIPSPEPELSRVTSAHPPDWLQHSEWVTDIPAAFHSKVLPTSTASLNKPPILLPMRFFPVASGSFWSTVLSLSQRG